MLCKYKDILGKPKKGIHSYRLFNIAVADVALTLIVSKLISVYTKIPVYKTFIVLFLLGILLHRLFCVRTTIDKLLFN